MTTHHLEFATLPDFSKSNLLSNFSVNSNLSVLILLHYISLFFKFFRFSFSLFYFYEHIHEILLFVIFPHLFIPHLFKPAFLIYFLRYYFHFPLYLFCLHSTPLTIILLYLRVSCLTFLFTIIRFLIYFCISLCSSLPLYHILICQFIVYIFLSSVHLSLHFFFIMFCLSSIQSFELIRQVFFSNL